MKSLFTEKESYIKEAAQISREFSEVLRPIFEKYKDLYQIRELKSIADNAILVESAHMIIKKYGKIKK